MPKFENPSPFTWGELAACMERLYHNRERLLPQLVEHRLLKPEEAQLELAKLSVATDHFRALDCAQGEQLAPAATAPKPLQELKQEVIRLLNNPLIKSDEKSSMLVALNRFNEERAQTAIDKLRATIADREQQHPATI